MALANFGPDQPGAVYSIVKVVNNANSNEVSGKATSGNAGQAGALAVTDVAIFRDAYAPLIRPAAIMPTPQGLRLRGRISRPRHAIMPAAKKMPSTTKTQAT